MATKQLNSANPRNFKEKIELLKKKEAASTAIFAAAMRDAREIRQIAVACDPTQLHLKSRAAKGILERSLSKACSVPNVGSASYIFDSQTNGTNCTSQTAGFIAKDTSVSPTGNEISHDQAQVHSSNANGHLVSLLNSPATPRNSLSCDTPSTAAYQTNNQPNWQISSNRVFNFPNLSTPVPHSFNSTTRAVTHCSGAFGTSLLPSTNEAPSAFPNRRVLRYASGDQLPSTVDRYMQCNPHPPSNGTAHPCAPFSTPPRSTHTAPLLHDYPNTTMPTVCTPTHYYQPAGRSLCTAQTSLGPLHSSSPYCGTQAIGPYQRTTYDNHNNMQQLIMSGGYGISDARSLSNASGTNPNIDWRRVSSDSSIRHSLLSYPTTSSELTEAYNGMPSTSTVTNTGASHSNLPLKSSETLRRQFPVVEDGIEPSVCNQQNYCSYSPNAVPPASRTSTSPHHSPGGLTEEHLLPAKRPFTGFNSQPTEGSTVDHEYTQMGGLSLEDSGSVPLKTTSGNRPVADNNRSQTPGASSSKNATQIYPSTTPTPNIKVHTGDMPNELNSSQAFDPGDLDRYLQIPSAFLDYEGSESWVGRRNSCTMTAEVLSALSTVHNESPLASDRIKGEVYPGRNSCYPKPVLRSDMHGLTEFSADYDGNHTAMVFGPNHTHASSVQDVASKLGISMTPNDYQLLTNPQLANYVTDETTETQLLG